MPFPNQKPQTYTILISEEQRTLLRIALNNMGGVSPSEAIMLDDMLDALPGDEKECPGIIHDFVFSPFG